MKISKNNQVFLLIFIFSGLGLAALLVYDPSEQSADKGLDYSRVSLVSNKDYPQQVRQWLKEVSAADALAAVRAVKAKILNFRGADDNLGQAQVNLYLAFDYLEQFLVTKDSKYKAQVAANLAVVAQLFPELNPDIDNFKNFMN